MLPRLTRIKNVPVLLGGTKTLTITANRVMSASTLPNPTSSSPTRAKLVLVDCTATKWVQLHVSRVLLAHNTEIQPHRARRVKGVSTNLPIQASMPTAQSAQQDFSTPTKV